MKNTPLRHDVQYVFFKFNALFVLLAFQIIYQGQDQHGGN